jgi:hypothetical protein
VPIKRNLKAEQLKLGSVRNQYWAGHISKTSVIQRAAHSTRGSFRHSSEINKIDNFNLILHIVIKVKDQQNHLNAAILFAVAQNY